MSIYVPRMVESKTTINWRQWYAASLVLGLALFALFYIGVRLFFFSLYGPNYADSYTILLLAMPIAIFFPARALTESYLTINHWNWSLIILNLTINVIGITLLVTIRYFFAFTTVSAVYYLTTMAIYMGVVTWMFWRSTAHSN